MQNPLMQFVGRGTGSMLPAPLGNMMNFMQEFNKFRSSFQGDPKQKVQELLKSGQMTQEQYAQYEQLAKQIMPFLK